MQVSTQPNLEPYRPDRDGPFGMAEIAHLLRRTEFGATPERMRALLELGPKGAVADILDRDPKKSGRRYRTLLRMKDRIARRNEISAIQAWWTQAILAAERPFVEHLTLFWHDHFATAYFKVADTVAMQDQISLLREKGGGAFDDLLTAMARDPAMLRWLDNDVNTRRQANENFARELFELFALGIGNYSESDVRESARAFTGWGIKNGRFSFHANQHDPGDKKILGHRGKLDGDDVLEIIAADKSSSRFIAGKLFRWFVRDDPSEAEKTMLGAEFDAADRSVDRFLEKLFQSRLFFDPKSRSGLFRSPIQYAAALLRPLGARVDANHLLTLCRAMGQELYNPPSVEGWKGGRQWINSSTLIARQNLAWEVSSGEKAKLSCRLDRERRGLEGAEELAWQIQGCSLAASGALRGLGDPKDFDQRALVGQLALHSRAHLA